MNMMTLLAASFSFLLGKMSSHGPIFTSTFLQLGIGDKTTNQREMNDYDEKVDDGYQAKDHLGFLFSFFIILVCLNLNMRSSCFFRLAK